MKVMIVFTLYFLKSEQKSVDIDKKEFCLNLECDDLREDGVCGIKPEGDGFRLKLFKNQCELLKYGCQVDNNEAYGIINMEYCKNSFDGENAYTIAKSDLIKDECDKPCSQEKREVCGIKQEGKGFKVRLFINDCELAKYNCKNNLEFIGTDLYYCNGLSIEDDKDKNEEFKAKSKQLVDNEQVKEKTKPLIVVDATMFNKNNNINDSIDNFFAATHVFDLPMEEIRRSDLNETSRRMLLKIAGPVKVFKPWITIPKNISDDYYHKPTLSSCYHTCPTKCPDTYAPVCGVPGIVAREPSLMFKNHCFMDVAQCKMQWEDKSPTALSSFYIESSFLFCLGDELNGLYRFLPLIRTLQHMGRLKKKGHFRYKLKNMRFFNNLLSREPKLMG